MTKNKPKFPMKIEDAIASGYLIPFEKVLERFTPEEREEIDRISRYHRAAAELRRIRKYLKISQKELADKMKVKREYIARIESGKQNITLDTLYKIADATGKKFRFWFE